MEMRKKLPAPRRLPAEGVPEALGVDRNQHKISDPCKVPGKGLRHRSPVEKWMKPSTRSTGDPSNRPAFSASCHRLAGQIL
jgi:hypothetical protein